MCKRHPVILLSVVSALSLLMASKSVANDLKVDGTLEVSGGVEGARLVLGKPAPCNPVLAGCTSSHGASDGSLMRVHGDAAIEGALEMGAKTRQMINMFGAGYGIGVQDFAFYERTGNEFFWYKGGDHSSANGNAGPGGARLMHLDNTGMLTVTGLTFTEKTKQMIDLFGAGYGVGVQDFAFYQRTGNEFYWYRGGDHSSANGDAGQGGTRLMRLDNRGILTLAQGVVTPVLQITGGTDVAEPFKISGVEIAKGSVVSIDQDNVGYLRLSREPYDRRVAGIVSGAHGINPGISLAQEGVTDGGLNVALSGRVYALADASEHPIRSGDLLTSSSTPGYAMKAIDHDRAQGAIIGKAMTELHKGKGFILVLVTLQ